MRRNSSAAIDGCIALRNHLDIKRLLTSDEELRREYGRVKMALAGQDFANIGGYAVGKNGILFGSLKEAGWNEGDLKEARNANSGIGRL
jgi:GrpB-like predicted nucleotidyltransferase (UPF0157 family)